MRCSLCGYEFDPATLACHTGCPLGKHCHLICCPNCGYQVVDESRSRAAGWLRRWLPGRRDAPALGTEAAPVPLTTVPTGVEVQVHALADMPPARQARLNVFGLAPGSRITLMQRYPACLVRVDETELALSAEIAGQIWVTAGA